MIDITDLRPGNYVQETGVPEQVPLRVTGTDLLQRRIMAKADFQPEEKAYSPAQLEGCPLETLMKYMGGLGFGEHSLLLKGPGDVYVIHAEGTALPLPHIRHVHQFQNLFRSLTGQELPFNLG